MSRTTRRNNKELIRKKFGHPDSKEHYFFIDFDLSGSYTQRVEWLPRYENEMAFKRAVRRYTSDRYRRWRTAPRWWKKLYYIDPERRASKQEIHRCIRQDDFDDHQDPHYRGANADFHWCMT